MRRLKILIAVMLIMLIFLLGYGHSKAWDIEMIMEPVGTGSVNTWTVNTGTVATGNVMTGVSSTGTETTIYTWEMTARELALKVNKVVGNYDISYAIVNECASQVDDYKQCIKNVIWVSNAESWIFKAAMKPSNNWFGLMYKWKKRRFSSVQEWIHVWVSLYKKNWWGKRTTGQAWLNWKYCVWSCSNRVKLYNAGINKLGPLD